MVGSIICEKIPTIWRKIVIIGPIDPDILWLQEIIRNTKKYNEINASNKHSLDFRHVEWAKLETNAVLSTCSPTPATAAHFISNV